MISYFHAVAIDYDGTLTRTPRPAAAVLDAVRAVRDGGLRVLLVTGRILAELRADFPEVDEHFDAIVAENGAVLSRPPHPARPLTTPIDAALERALCDRGVPVRRGEILLATEVVWGEVVTEEIGRLGLECQIVRNRGALMVLPAGVTKGSGLVEALAEFGISWHSTVSIGDAENDHSLLDACEIGVAVGDAVESLKSHAEIVLPTPNGEGVTGFLVALLHGEIADVAPKRRLVTLGTYDDGSPAIVPAARINIAIHGDSGSGKSYVAGLVAEQLISMSYTLCILDLEGDHLAVGALHGAVVFGGREALPAPEQIGRVLCQGFTSVVVDLSLQRTEGKRAYAISMLDQLLRTRQETGLPHWIFVDEAHVPMTRVLRGWWCRDPTQTGLCLVTYKPELLCPGLDERAAYVIVLSTDRSATLEHRGAGPARRFTPGERSTSHVRHWHKYLEGQLPSDRRFYFRNQNGLTDRSAGNLMEFHDEIRSASDATLRHHAAYRDFTRWLADLWPDAELLAEVRDIEEALAAAHDSSQGSALRDRLARTVERHTPRPAVKAPPP